MRTGASSISIGELVPGAEAKLMKDDGTEQTEVGSRGELWIRSPNGMCRYWKNHKATEETMTSDGWLKTGDIAYRDEHDRWYMVDRIKVKYILAAIDLVQALIEFLEGIDQGARGTSRTGGARSIAT